jgi:type III restriction enzyme
MNFYLEPDLDYQLYAAIKTVCALFQGQETCQTEFTVTLGKGHLQLAHGHRFLCLANTANLF